MKIGLDYSGVISFAPNAWAESMAKAQVNGHKLFIICYTQPGDELQIRHNLLTNLLGVTDLIFIDLEMDPGGQKMEIAQRKAELCKQHGIEIFIDDDFHRTEAVSRVCDRCAVLYIPRTLWQIGERLINGLGKDH